MGSKLSGCACAENGLCEPNNYGGEDCAAFIFGSFGAWQDRSCSEQIQSLICEYQGQEDLPATDNDRLSNGAEPAEEWRLDDKTGHKLSNRGRIWRLHNRGWCGRQTLALSPTGKMCTQTSSAYIARAHTPNARAHAHI